MAVGLKLRPGAFLCGVCMSFLWRCRSRVPTCLDPWQLWEARIDPQNPGCRRKWVYDINGQIGSWFKRVTVPESLSWEEEKIDNMTKSGIAWLALAAVFTAYSVCEKENVSTIGSTWFDRFGSRSLEYIFPYLRNPFIQLTLHLSTKGLRVELVSHTLLYCVCKYLKQLKSFFIVVCSE